MSYSAARIGFFSSSILLYVFISFSGQDRLRKNERINDEANCQQLPANCDMSLLESGIICVGVKASFKFTEDYVDLIRF